MTNATTLAKFQRSMDEKVEDMMHQMMEQSLASAEGVPPQPAQVEQAVAAAATANAAQPADALVLDTLQRLESMAMQQATTIAKFEKKISERTEGLESMAMQAAMSRAKETSQSKEALERLEGMGMTNATTVAKFQRTVAERFEEVLQALMEEMTSLKQNHREQVGSTAPSQNPSDGGIGSSVSGDGLGTIESAIQRVEGMAMTLAQAHAKFSQKVLERTETLESMAMQGAMNQSKAHGTSTETLDRLESMGMANATTVAKMERKLVEKSDSIESMSLTAAMNNAKFEKKLDDRTAGIESMAVAQSMTQGKVLSMLTKMAGALPDAELTTPDMPESSPAFVGVGHADEGATSATTDE